MLALYLKMGWLNNCFKFTKLHILNFFKKKIYENYFLQVRILVYFRSKKKKKNFSYFPYYYINVYQRINQAIEHSKDFQNIDQRKYLFTSKKISLI